MGAYHQGIMPKKSKDDWYKDQQKRSTADCNGPCMNPLIVEPKYSWKAPMLIMCFIWPQAGGPDLRAARDTQLDTRPVTHIDVS